MIRPPAQPEQPREKRLDILGFNPLDHIPLRRAFVLAQEMQLEEVLALLLYHGSHAHANTNRIAKEVNQMQDQIKAMAGEISAQIVELTAAYSKIGEGIENEVLNARSRLTPDSDPEVWISLKRITDLVLAMKMCEMNVRGVLTTEDTASAIPPTPEPGPALLPSSF